MIAFVKRVSAKTWMLWAALVASGLVLGLCLGCPLGFIVSKWVPPPLVAGTSYTREAFEKRFTGLGMDDVRAALGGPDRVEGEWQGGGESAWIYKRRVVNPQTGEPYEETILNLHKERVSTITYSPK